MALECCVDVVLGQDFQKFHDSVILPYDRKLPSLLVGGLINFSVQPSALFANLKLECHPTVTKSRGYSDIDRKFKTKTKNSLRKTLLDQVIRQVVCMRDYSWKLRLAIDYSLKINRFTLLDSYPLLHIDETVNRIACSRIFRCWQCLPQSTYPEAR